MFSSMCFSKRMYIIYRKSNFNPKRFHLLNLSKVLNDFSKTTFLVHYQFSTIRSRQEKLTRLLFINKF